MRGLMMDYPLTVTAIMERAKRLFPDKEIVTKAGPTLERYTYREMFDRAGQLANALKRLGVQPGDRVATFAWNNPRHLELYFAIPSMGAVLHPLNIRLAVDQLAYILCHAEDSIIFVDPTLLPLVEKMAPMLSCARLYIVMGAKVPEGCTLSPVYAYEDLLAAESPDFDWPVLDENDAAAMCYTSGTTGNPKGVLYSHRSIFLHSLGLTMTDSFGMGEHDVFMPVVPMFHVLAWGTPFAGTMVGVKWIMPGPHMTPRDLAELIQAERVTLTAGVPTLWLGMLALLDRELYDLSSVRMMIVGGAAAPQSMIEAYEQRHGIEVMHAWGMTETSPLGTVSRLRSWHKDLDKEAQYVVRAKQGAPVPCVDIRAINEAGKEVPWDGKSYGELQVKGPWIVSAYYNDDRTPESFSDGWFKTGDVVTISPDGYMQIVDRTKDLVKSGGEWISSQDLENTIMGCPKVAEAAVIAIPHPKWQERPLACVVPKPEHKDTITKEDIYAALRPKFSHMYMPDDVVFVESLPKTSVGKFDKKVLRSQFHDYAPADR